MRPSAILWIAALTALAACSQQVTMPVVQPSVNSITDYFWTSPDTLALTDGQGHGTNLLTMSGTGGLIQVSDTTGASLNCVVNDDSVFAQGFRPHSVIDLDDGSYFSGSDREVYVAHKLTAMCMTGTSSNYPIVGTDTGIFEYDASQKRYQFKVLAGQTITFLAFDYYHLYAYAATSDSLWKRDAGGAWGVLSRSGLPSGRILAFISDDTDDHFAAVKGANGIYEYRHDAVTWKKLGYLAARQVTALAMYHYQSVPQILTGTIDGNFGICSPNGVQIIAPALLPGAGRVNCLLTQANNAYAGTDMGLLFNVDGLTTAWSSVAGASNSISQISNYTSSGISFLSNGGVFTYNVPPGVVGNLRTPNNAIALASNYQPFEFDDTTLYSYDIGNTNWSAHFGFPRYHTIRIPGGLVLMRRGGLTVGQSWQAGTLVTDKDSFYAFTARVIQRLDSLQISGKSYPDVFVIRYSHELPNMEADSVAAPYWVLYYSRGFGPVMFDRVKADPASQPAILYRRQRK